MFFRVESEVQPPLRRCGRRGRHLFFGVTAPKLPVPLMMMRPLHFAAVLPFSLFLHSVLTDVGADSVLFSSFPFTDVLSSISPYEGALTLPFIIYKIAFVFLSILPL